MSILLLASCQPTRPDWSEGAKVAGIVVAAAAAVGGLVAGISYLSTPSNDQVAANARAELHNVSMKYASVLQEFDKNLISAGYFNEYSRIENSNNILNSANEPFLYAIATDLWQKGASQSSYRSSLCNAVSSLRSLHDELCKRVQKLQQKRTISYKEHAQLQDMQLIANNITAYLPSITLFKNYIERHGAFFALAEAEWDAFKQYQDELKVIEMYQYNAYALQQELHRIACSKKSSYVYPYVAYVQSLDHHINCMRTNRKAAKYMYTDRFAWSDALIQNLEYIRITIDAAYKTQLLQKQRDDIEAERRRLEQERERLKIERERLQAEYYRNESQRYHMQREQEWQRHCKQLENDLARINNELHQHEHVIAQLQVNVTI